MCAYVRVYSLVGVVVFFSVELVSVYFGFCYISWVI